MHTYRHIRTIFSSTNIYTYREHTHLSPTHRYPPPPAPPHSSCKLPRPSYAPITRPEVYLENTRTNTPPKAAEVVPLKRFGIRERSPGLAQPACMLGNGQQTPGTWKTGSPSSQSLPPRCPHQLPAVSVSTPLCEATSCVTFTFTLSSGVLAAHFPAVASGISPTLGAVT